MKTKGSFLSYIAQEKKQRKEEVKPSGNSGSYSSGRQKNAAAQNESVHYQIS
jgi:hypothetical protein